MMKTQKIVIDTDPGVDDAFAILLAHACLDPADILAVTTTAGNVGIDSTTHNALGLKRLLNASYEVYQGADRPLEVPFHDASHIHGSSGMGEYQFREVAALEGNEPAWDALYRIAKREGKISLITLGPLTNIALTLTKYPDFPDYIERLISMGGSTGKGNRTPFSEFNYYCDPHAAAIVFASDLPVTMVGLNVTEQAFADSATMSSLVVADRAINELVSSLKVFYRGTISGISPVKGYHLPDAVAVAACIDEGLCRYESLRVSIVIEEGERQGMSAVGTEGANLIKVAVGVDPERFRSLLLRIATLGSQS